MFLIIASICHYPYKSLWKAIKAKALVGFVGDAAVAKFLPVEISVWLPGPSCVHLFKLSKMIGVQIKALLMGSSSVVL